MEHTKYISRPRDGIELRPITEPQDLEKLDSVWTYRNPNSLPFFQRMAKYNTNIGAFTEDGTLVAWLFR